MAQQEESCIYYIVRQLGYLLSMFGVCLCTTEAEEDCKASTEPCSSPIPTASNTEATPSPTEDAAVVQAPSAEVQVQVEEEAEPAPCAKAAISKMLAARQLTARAGASAGTTQEAPQPRSAGRTDLGAVHEMLLKRQQRIIGDGPAPPTPAIADPEAAVTPPTPPAAAPTDAELSAIPDIKGRVAFLCKERGFTNLRKYSMMLTAGTAEDAVLHRMRIEGVADNIMAMLCPSPAIGMGAGSNTQSQPKSSGPSLEEDTGASRWLRSDVVLSAEDVRQLLEGHIAEATTRKPSPAKAGVTVPKPASSPCPRPGFDDKREKELAVRGSGLAMEGQLRVLCTFNPFTDASVPAREHLECVKDMLPLPTEVAVLLLGLSGPVKERSAVWYMARVLDLDSTEMAGVSQAVLDARVAVCRAKVQLGLELLRVQDEAEVLMALLQTRLATERAVLGSDLLIGFLSGIAQLIAVLEKSAGQPKQFRLQSLSVLTDQFVPGTAGKMSYLDLFVKVLASRPATAPLLSFGDDMPLLEAAATTAASDLRSRATDLSGKVQGLEALYKRLEEAMAAEQELAAVSSRPPAPSRSASLELSLSGSLGTSQGGSISLALDRKVSMEIVPETLQRSDSITGRKASQATHHHRLSSSQARSGSETVGTRAALVGCKQAGGEAPLLVEAKALVGQVQALAKQVDQAVRATAHRFNVHVDDSKAGTNVLGMLNTFRKAVAASVAKASANSQAQPAPAKPQPPAPTQRMAQYLRSSSGPAALGA